jgi:hypothetical protein
MYYLYHYSYSLSKNMWGRMEEGKKGRGEEGKKGREEERKKGSGEERKKRKEGRKGR